MPFSNDNCNCMDFQEINKIVINDMNEEPITAAVNEHLQNIEEKLQQLEKIQSPTSLDNEGITETLSKTVANEEAENLTHPTTNFTSNLNSFPCENITPPPSNDITNTTTALNSLHQDYELRCQQYEQQLQQLKAASVQKDNVITLLQRENYILEKEKDAYRKEKEAANKEKESIVIKFANKEKLLLDAKKEKENVKKQLADARNEVKNCTTRFQNLNEEKSRITYILDEKCNEIRKYQRECEKLKGDLHHSESKLKYHINKLNIETEAKLMLEKKLEEERNAPSKLEEKAYEKLKVEFEAQTILLKHETTHKNEQMEKLIKDSEQKRELIKQLREQLSREIQEKTQTTECLNNLQQEHNTVQNLYTEEMLNAASLRGQLEVLQVLKTQHALNQEELCRIKEELKTALQNVQENEQDLKQLHEKEDELLSINKEMSESIVGYQNEICLLKSEVQGITTENDMLRKEKSKFDEKYETLEKQLQAEQNQKNEERLLLAKHLSEKTKLYEIVKLKLDNVLGDFEATKHKHATSIKELQREIVKYKKMLEQKDLQKDQKPLPCIKCQETVQSNGYAEMQEQPLEQLQFAAISNPISVEGGVSSKPRGSESSESDTKVTPKEVNFKGETKGPSKKHLIERILRLQQASARQAEKIDFLENHTLSLIAELQKKSKVVQYYMLRDQSGALTTTKSDQNKSELAKYGNGVMSAIYNGIKGAENKSMTLELSLEINRKLQAVLEDTLLKNITLKENLDVLGLEVEELTHKLRQSHPKEV